jgi:energy-coupling factor transporter ATP-binding protein EcfA2
MRLQAITIQKFRNFVEPQRIEIEGDVTCLVGKNESGKTTILKALHRLRPANGSDTNFDLTTEYPRWRLARDRRQNASLPDLRPIVAEFTLESSDVERLGEMFGAAPPPGTICIAAKSYANKFYVWLQADAATIFAQAAREASLPDDDTATLLEAETIDAARTLIREQAKQLRDQGEGLRAKAWNGVPAALDKYAYLTQIAEQEKRNALAAMLPKFFYFSSYDVLPGECDLTQLTAKLVQGATPTDGERTVIALLAHAGEKPKDFMDADYNSRKAELQAASVDLSRHVFEYWKQNEDLEVIFDTDNVVVTQTPEGNQVAHRILKIELRDGRHGNVETNFSTRSAGFQWFFSFFAAFSEYQESQEAIIVLLDEPGTSLHGDAQRDFVRFVFQELGSAKQTMYTTHSQHMVDPTKYEKLRAVHDRATRTDPDQGVAVTRVNLSADRGTILPIESALGYSVSQHLFLGSGHHLTVEGSSDFIYLQRVTEHLLTLGESGLDPRLAIIPVGGVDNMPAFVALLGRRLKVSALVDGDRASAKLARIKAAARDNGVPEDCIVLCADADPSLPTNADIEDLFDTRDYLRLYNWAFGTSLVAGDLAATNEPIVRRVSNRVGEYDHALPAHALTAHREEFFAAIQPTSLTRFRALFELLNATLSVE